MQISPYRPTLRECLSRLKCYRVCNPFCAFCGNQWLWYINKQCILSKTAYDNTFLCGLKPTDSVITVPHLSVLIHRARQCADPKIIVLSMKVALNELGIKLDQMTDTQFMNRDTSTSCKNPKQR